MNALAIFAIAVAPHIAPHVTPHIAPAPVRVAPKPMVVPTPTTPRPPIIAPAHITPKCEEKKEKCK